MILKDYEASFIGAAGEALNQAGLSDWTPTISRQIKRYACVIDPFKKTLKFRSSPKLVELDACNEIIGKVILDIKERNQAVERIAASQQ